VQEDATFRFVFSHSETPNSWTLASEDPSTRCPAQEDDNGCPDIVSVSPPDSSDNTFWVGDTKYTLDILGFAPIGANGQRGGPVQNLTFISPEGGDNSAVLVAELNAASVPLPAAGWMLIAGIGGLVAMKRRQKARA
jgi:hypothetical protein